MYLGESEERRGTARRRPFVWLGILAAVLIAFNTSAQERTPPTPMPNHPGNVYVEGEDVVVVLPENLPPAATHWRALDDRGNVVSQGTIKDSVALGTIGIGWYDVEFLDADGQKVARTTAAVLAPWNTSIPDDSPVCLDGAVSWFATDDPVTQEAYASLTSLAGANWIRDRLRWREIEPERGSFAPPTQYDKAAQIQQDHGLHVLQVWHDTPKWATDSKRDHGRFAPDLRDVYRFSENAAHRFGSTVDAWEPWNEANSGNFGGQTIDEMCANQKAAYLGFKAGNPDVTVCWQPIAGVNAASMADGILANETWPYYEAYSIHSYDWPDSYDRLWDPARRASAGRPIWVTECDRGMRPDPESEWGDFTREDALKKAAFMAHSYATSLFNGADRHFHFILGHYMEQHGAVQFGLLRKDLTPRPSYVATAALGRFLAGATCLGRWHIENQPDAHIYAFRGVPDGEPRDVLIAWFEHPGDWDRRGTATLDWSLPSDVRVSAVFDYLGRPIPSGVPATLESNAVFLILPENEADKLSLEAPRRGEWREGEASPVVLQLEMAERTVVDKTQGWTPQYERALDPGVSAEMRILVYNLSKEPVVGKVAFEDPPQGWTLGTREWTVSVPPLERAVCATNLILESWPDNAEPPWVRVTGDFGVAGQPVAAFRFYANEKGTE